MLNELDIQDSSLITHVKIVRDGVETNFALEPLERENPVGPMLEKQVELLPEKGRPKHGFGRIQERVITQDGRR